MLNKGQSPEIETEAKQLQDSPRVTQDSDGDSPAPRLAFPVVGLGASAGGLEAFAAFLDAMPADSGIAFVMILHLPPDRDSMMADILSKHTKMPVIQVEDGMAVQANHVYVIRPGFTLTLHNGRLHLSEPLEKRGHRRPVDDFFRSLAEEQRERGIAVVMAGMGTNGSAGAQAIKAAGGICIAQEPSTAKHDSMPRSLIDVGLADCVLAPEAMPQVLIAYTRHPYVQHKLDPAALLRPEAGAFSEILGILRSRFNHDFSSYKKATLTRRILRRMGLVQLKKFSDYAEFLRQNPRETTSLLDDLMINVTGFFRDLPAWEALQSQAIMPLLKDRQDRGPIRAWVTACASGEEAYTLAMVLSEQSEILRKQFDVKIFATDTAKRALSHARAGVYPGGIESEISPERIDRFFEKDDNSYRIKKQLRETVIFAPQNLLQDPPFSLLDIVCCRNLLIYLEPPIQRKVLGLLHFALREGGYLFLGTAETITNCDGLFEPIDRKWRIYRRIGAARPAQVEVPIYLKASAPPGAADLAADPAALRPPLIQMAHRGLLERYTPPSVVVDRRMRVLFFHGDTQRFFSQPPGEPTQALLSITRESLRGAVRTAIRRAFSENTTISIDDGHVETPAGMRKVTIVASPLERQESPPHFIISFKLEPEPAPSHSPEPALSNEHSHDSDKQLEAELLTVRGELQNTIEDLESSNEELKASNEEITSMNEELQSTNEELETGKEELQSLNEELSTVNSQLQSKVEELESTTNDLSNLLANTQIATIFLDTHLRIRRFTPATHDLIELTVPDLGRPINHFAQKFVDPTLLSDAQLVIEKLVPREAEVESTSKHFYLRRILPYRTSGNRIEGIIITFVDITERKAAIREIEVARERLQVVLEQMPAAVILADTQERILFGNRALENMFGAPVQLMQNVNDYRGLARRLSGEPFEHDMLPMRRALKRGEVIVNEELWYKRRDGNDLFVSVGAAPIHSPSGEIVACVITFLDVTYRRQSEIDLRRGKELAESAMRIKDEFLAMISHELRNPLSAILLWGKMLRDGSIDTEQERIDALDAVVRSAESQQQLIDDLLDLARSVSGKMRLKPKEVDLVPIVRTSVDAVHSAAESKKINVEVKLDVDKCVVNADPDRMQQVFWNLLSNAVKFTPASGRVSVRVAVTGERVRIVVSDTGKGISKDFLPHVFERFKQAETKFTADTTVGLGLGLAIVQELVESHGGTVACHSDGEGKGATFTVELPILNR